MLTKITVETQGKAAQVVRADLSGPRAKQVGPVVDMPPGMKMEFLIHQTQGLVVRETPE